MNTATFRRPLNSNQLQTLLLIFKFRFVTAPLLANLSHKSRSNVQQTLQLLEEQNYLGKSYNSCYRLQGKQAIYYLKPMTIWELKERYKLSEAALTAMTRNARVSESFMEHHVTVMKVYLNFKQRYGATFKIFSQYELGGFPYFIRPLPNLYLHRVTKTRDLPTDYLLDVFTNTPAFVLKKRLNAYVRHQGTSDWQIDTQSPYPTIIMCCPNPRTESTVRAHIERLIDRSGANELTAFTTTTKSLLSEEPTIWSNAAAPEKIIVSL